MDDDGDGVRRFAHLAGHGPRARARSSRSARPRRAWVTSDHWIHRKGSPRCAPPPSRRTTATKASARAILPSRSHPLRRPLDRRETAPAALDPTRVPSGIARTRGWLPGGPHAAAPRRTARTAPAPTRTRRRTPRLERNRRNAQTVRPPDRSLGRGWTPEAQSGIVTHGGRVFRRARHEGSGDQTRAFTFSIDPLLLRRRRPRWR